MKIIPRTLGVAEIMSVPVHDEIVTAHMVEQIAHNETEKYSVNCYTESLSKGDFPLQYFCIGINTADNRGQLVGLGYPTPDGAVPVIHIYYLSKRPDHAQWEMKTLEQLQFVVSEFNRIVRHIRALEKGPENGLPVQSKQKVS